MKIKFFLLLLFISLLGACSSNPDPLDDNRPSLTVIIPSFGLGDMGYDDLIMSGVMKFYEQNDVIMSLRRIGNAESPAEIIRNWISESAGNRQSLLILASSEYESVLRSLDVKLSPNQKIILFESNAKNLPHGVSAFCIKRYGVSYLAGCMAQKSPSASIIAAMPGNSALSEAINGFSDAFISYNGKAPAIHYLADDVSGFDLSNDAYNFTSSLSHTFIFPLAGGSNIGIYKYLREYDFHPAIVAGMDVDCSSFTPRCPFSVVFHVDSLLLHFLSQWVNGASLPVSASFGLDSDWVDIVINDRFFLDIDSWDEYLDGDDAYWSSFYNKYKKEAIDKEHQYETTSI